MPAAKNHWIVKQEPESYSWADFVKDGRTAWTGVRSFPARLNLRAMRKGDPVFYYHSGDDKHIVGVAEVVREAYPDPTAEEGEGEWVCVDLIPLRPLAHPVTLAAIKADKALASMLLVRQSRLSVSPLTREQFDRILELGR
jgi:predicted RNA-binding protein with PUA-like domain